MQIFTRTKHINEEALALLALNDLPAARRNLVQEHLSGCSQCRGQFQDTREFIDIFRLLAKSCSAAPLTA